MARSFSASAGDSPTKATVAGERRVNGAGEQAGERPGERAAEWTIIENKIKKNNINNDNDNNVIETINNKYS